ncbi:MAG: hypothetical protein WCF23_18390 [Candidatus Nitrosopolaris sp.]
MQPNQEPTSKIEQKISFNNRLLLVDDEPDAISHKRWFEANGFEVHAFHDPRRYQISNLAYTVSY